MKNSNNSICPRCSSAIPADAPDGLCPKCALEGAATVSTPTTGGRHTSPPRIEEIAPHFPDLEILELLGAGGMGAVYKARQPQIDRFIALKILSHDLASDPAFVERFNREARVLGRLSHPNIVGIHDFGTAGPYCYLLMEYIDGVNLRQAMKAGRFTPTEALAMVQHLCSALKFAHEEGILHRDIKPENILIDSKGRVKVADFGIAKLVGEDRQHDFTLTLQGSVLGSPHYMAPEQIETPGDVDQRADIYSLGVVLYEMLTGGLPIGRFALPSQKAVMDARIDHIVLRTLEKERSARYQTAGEVGTEVEAVTKHPAPTPAKASPAAGEAGAARFSLTSALLTGSGVILTGLFLAFWVMTISGPVESPGELASAISAGLLIAVANILAAAGTSLLGFIFGARALAEIRRSGGVKTGLGLSIFAVTAWPILLLFPLATAFIYIPIPGRGLSLGPSSVIFIALLPVLAASWILVRGLCRWAGGVVGKDGIRSHPGMGRPLLMMLLAAIGLPILIVVAASFLPFAQRSGPPSGSPAERVAWLYGTPELSVAVKAGSDVSNAFRLVWIDEQGRVTREPIGESLESVVRIGMAHGKDGRGIGFVATLDATGQSAGIFQETDIEKWNLQIEDLYSGGNTLVFTSPQTVEITVATLRDGEGEIKESLILEVVTTKR